VSRTCPRCHLEKPPAALRCDCGYQFEVASEAGPSSRALMPCQRCGRQIAISSRFCSVCGAPAMAGAPPQVAKKSSTALVIGLVAAVFCVPLWLKLANPDTAPKPSASTRQKDYLSRQWFRIISQLDLSERIWRHGQRTVSLPWTLEMRAGPRQFLYLSAQKKEPYGTVKTGIYIDGHLLQEAESSTEYGIASASGVVPR
jgi:hypothetical protein